MNFRDSADGAYPPQVMISTYVDGSRLSSPSDACEALLVTDAGLQNLAGMASLSGLQLAGTQITDIGVERLNGLIRPESLNLNKIEVSNASLMSLQGLDLLTRLILRGIGVTEK